MKLKVNIFIIFFIIFSSEYYAQIIGPNNGSLMDIWDLSAQSGFNRKFTVLKSIKLKTVDVFPTNWNDGCQGDGSTKSTTIDLYKNGLLFSSKDVQVKCGKLASVDLNFDLNVGNYELRIRNIKQGSFKVSSDADEKSIAGVISLTDNRISGVNNTYSGVFFNWDIEVKIVKVVPLPDTIKICKGEKFNLEFSAANSEIWTGTEAFIILNDSTVQFAPTKSTVYYFESPSILPAGENSVVNGDFEKGNTGFTTEYRFNQNINTPGDYMIGSKGDNAYVNTVDRTLKTNAGKMLVADGADAIYNTINNYSMSVWCQTIKVYPNTNYQAEFWATQASNSTQFPSFLHMEINGVDVGNWLTPPSSGNWGVVNGVWNSGLNTSAEMCIKNGVSNSTGNNFLLDDISLIATEPILAYAKTDSVVVILCDSTVSSYKPEAGIGDFKTHEYNLNCGGDYYACIDLKAKGAKKYTWSSPSGDMQAITKLNDSTYQFCRINGGLNIFTPLQYQIIMESENGLEKDTIQLKINRNKCSEMGGGVSTLGNMEKTLPCGTDTVSLHAKGGKMYVWSSPSGNMNLLTKKNDSLYIFTKPNNSIGNYTYQVVSMWQNPACQFECKFEQIDTFLLKINTLDCTCIDTDKDGVCDEDDLDDDNDGILDVNECMISDFHWSSPPQVNGKTATGKINNIDYTYTSTVNILTSSSIYSYNTFPTSFNIPNTKVIRNDFISTNKINFAQPVLNPTLVFSSIGNGGKNVPIKFSNPVEILFKSGGVTVNSSTQISGQEGYVVLRMNGTYSEISFDYLANESWVNFSFGADFATFCDTDGDGIPDYLDTDSDGDGCFDAIEGGANFKSSDLDGEILKGEVDANGVPIIANGGQSIGTSEDKNKLDSECKPCTPPLAVVTTNTSLHYCKGSEGVILSAQDAGQNATYEWFKNGVSVSSPSKNSIYKYATQGKWAVKVAVETCKTLSLEVDVVEDLLPVAEITVNKPTYCKGENGVTLEVKDQGKDILYEWFKDGISQGKASKNRIINNAKAGKWEVKVFNPNFANPDLISEFNFNGDLKDTYNNSICTPLNLSTMNYVDGSLNWATTSTSGGGGFQILIPDAIFTESDYIIEADFQFSSISPSWHKIWDFKDKVSDAGLYYYNGSLQLYPNPTTGSTKVLPNVNYNVVLTRNGMIDSTMSNIMFNGNYTNESSTRDLDNNYVPTLLGSNRVINIFIDDNTTNTEFCSSGKVSTIRIWNRNTISSTCISKDSIEIKETDLPTINLGNDTTICLGKDLSINAPIAEVYKWNTLATTQSIKISDAGMYSVEITDTNGCKNKDTINIETQQCVNSYFNNDTLIICEGDSIEISANGVTTQVLGGTDVFKQINDSTIKVSPFKNAYYFIKENNINKDSILVIVKNNPDIFLGNDTTICKGDILNINLTLNGNYLWSTGETSASIKIKDKGVYRVQVENSDGCIGNDTIEIEFKKLPIINLGNDSTICMGDSVVLNAQNNGLNYLWNTGATTQKITVNQTGNYSVKVTDDIGCSDSSKIKIQVNDLPTINLGNDTTICENTTLNLDAKNSGLNYVWNNGATTQKITVAETGTYSVTVTDAIGCLSMDEIEIIVNPLPIVNLGKDTIFCIGGSVELDAQNNGLNYLWNTGATTQKITVNQTGNYSVKVTDDIGCSDSSKIKIQVNDLPTINLGNDTTICATAFVELDAKNPGLNYAWNTGASAQKIKVTQTGTYSVTVTDEIGCIGTDNIFITKEIIEDPYPEKEIYICEGTQVTLEPSFTNNYKIYWKENKNSETILVDEPGIYTSYVESEYCKETFVIQVFKIDTPMATITDINGKDFYCFDLETTTLTIQSGESNLIFDWDDFGRIDEVEITSAGTYKVTVYNQYCSSRFDKEIEDYCTGLLFIPNAFTPGNKDGVNDVFKPVVKNIQDYELRIFNRWGEMIFKTNDVNEGWDGTINGKNCQMDVYVYQIDYSYNSEFKGLIQKQNIGTFTLYR